MHVSVGGFISEMQNKDVIINVINKLESCIDTIATTMHF